MSRFEYDVALSFAGEDRNFARPLALALEDANYSVFYDEFEVASLWGTELSVTWADIYAHKSRFCLLILSKHYASKPWTNHERRFAIQNALQARTDYILPIRLDDSELPGWPSTVAYVDARQSSLSEILGLALSKFGAPDASPRIRATLEDRGVAEEIIRACFRRALFTRMNSEIHLGAMYESLGQCIWRVQQLVPNLVTSELQNIGIQLLHNLDAIQRHSTSGPEVSNYLSVTSKIAIDGLKLEAIQLLKRLRQRVGSKMLLPTSLSYDHFFAPQEGNEPPRLREDGQDLSVQTHLTEVEGHWQATIRRSSSER